MGALTDSANLVFRNFTAVSAEFPAPGGNPASPPYIPTKAEIRALFVGSDEALTEAVEAVQADAAAAAASAAAAAASEGAAFSFAQIAEEAAAQAPIDAAAAAEAVLASKPSAYATRALAEGASVPAVVQYIDVIGYADPDDGGHARFFRAGSEPSHEGKLQTADGAWWVISTDDNGRLNGRAFGALGTFLDDAADDAPAIQNALNAAAAMGVAAVFLSSGCYGVDSQIQIPRYVELRGVGSMMGTRWSTANAEWTHAPGTNFAITYGSGISASNEAFSAFLQTSGSGIDGVSFWYPNIAVTNMIASPPTTHGPTIGLKADTLNANNSVCNPYVRNCYVTNAYSFLCWTSHHGPGDIFNIKGFSCLRGFILDNAYDIDRMVDVHWNPNMTYQGVWASNGIAWSALALQGAFLLLYKADQAYFNKVFCWGMYYGAWFRNNGAGISANGASFVQCGLEANNRCLFSDGDAQYITFESCIFGSQDWNTTYPALNALRVASNAELAYGWKFNKCHVFRSNGSLSFYGCKGITFENFTFENVVNPATSPSSSIGIFTFDHCSRMSVQNGTLAASGDWVIYIVVLSCQAFEFRNIFGKGAKTGAIAGAVTNSVSGRCQNIYTNHGTLTAFGASGNTNVTLDALLAFTD